jgi:FlaA1/EpsC-like NDP-sugar epimerase
LNISRWIILVLDLVLVAIAFAGAHLLRFDFEIYPDDNYRYFQPGIFLLFSLRLSFFFLFRTYAGVVFHTSIEDARRLFYALLGPTFILLVFNAVGYGDKEAFLLPYSIILIEFFLSIFLLVSYRGFVKVLYMSNFVNEEQTTNVIIFGVGQAAVTVKNVLESSGKGRYSVKCFIDSTGNFVKQRLGGLDIYSLHKMERLIITAQIDTLVFADGSLDKNTRDEVVDICLKYKVKILSAPPFREWSNGDLDFKQIREIRIEDLLERKEISLNTKKISSELDGKTILITGAAGSIGSEIARQVLRFDVEKLILVDQGETPLYELNNELRHIDSNTRYEIVIGDVRNLSRMERAFKLFSPDVVYHAAAYKHVPLMEQNPSEAILTNVHGTKNIADLCGQFKVEKMVYISTDKAVNPSSIMGASKRIGEIYIQSLNTALSEKGKHCKFVTTRFGNVLGSNGSVIPLFRRQIAEGGPITVTHPEMTRYFMTIPEACQLVLEAGAMGKGGEIFVFDMGASVKIYDLAKKMISLSGLQEGRDIEIVFSGLRPGEKLYEELLANEEHNLPTHHDKIMIAKVRTIEFNGVLEMVNELLSLFNEQDNKKLVTQLKRMIPEYKSLNSKYEDLDN